MSYIKFKKSTIVVLHYPYVSELTSHVDFSFKEMAKALAMLNLGLHTW